MKPDLVRMKEGSQEMISVMNFPSILSICTVLCLWATARLGAFARGRFSWVDEEDHEGFSLLLGATLTLLGLLIGFSFSMASNRYDQRKDYEEEEANAIGTEYVRADLLPDPSRTKIKQLLVEYLDLRIQRYDAHADQDVSAVVARTAQHQDELWSEVKNAAEANPNPVMATVVVGMNDVLNRQGYTQAARLNRIPIAAWGLMAAIALFSNFLIGLGSKKSSALRLLIFPFIVAVSFLLIADIDSPQGGLIRVRPQNLQILADSLRPQ
jgi:hypothetical protein